MNDLAIMGRMAAAPQHLTLEEFDRLYGGQKPYHEYWFGQAVQKPVPNRIHALLQYILSKLLEEIGLIPGAEVRLMLSEEAQPLPDLIATSTLEFRTRRSLLKLPSRFCRHRTRRNICFASAAGMQNGAFSRSSSSILRTEPPSAGINLNSVWKKFARLMWRENLRFR